MRRRTLATLGLGAAAVASLALLLAALIGALTLVVTHGNSMEPTYRGGDVVVVRHADSYAVGDVAAYRSPMLDDQIVLHRIVDSAGDGFVLSGDNNTWLDPERPAADELLGTAWLHVPRLGIPARWLGDHAPLAAAGAFVLVAGTGTAAGTRRRRTVKEHVRPTPAGRAGGYHQLAAGLLVGLLAFGLLAAVSWTRPATTAGPVGFTHEGEFTHTATASTGPVYAAARVRTGQPLFLRLIDDVRVGFSYRFAAEEPTATRGTIGLRARVDNGTGWTRTLEVAAPQPFDGTEADIAGPLDLDAIRSLVSKVAAATGESGATTITLRAQITVEGEVAGEPLEERFSPSLAYQLTETQLRVAAEGDDTDSFTAQGAGELQVPGREAAVLSWAGRTMDVATAQWLSLAAMVACAAGLLVLPVASRRTAGLSETERITRRWPDLIVAVDVESMLPARVVRMGDMAALVALAQRSDRPVLHDRATGAFLLDLDGTQYRYEPTAPATPFTPAARPAPAAPAPPSAPLAAVPLVPPPPARTPLGHAPAR